MSLCSTGVRESSPHGNRTFLHCHSWFVPLMLGLVLIPVCFSLEVSVGKNPQMKARNGTDVLLHCSFSACFGFEDVYFLWNYQPMNSTFPSTILYKGFVKDENTDPKPTQDPDYQVELAFKRAPKDYNISLLLKNVDFSNNGRYTCDVMNTKEKKAKHNATLTLTVVDKFEVVDNTLTLIIVAVVGGVIGLLILILIMKKIISIILKRNSDTKKDCLVSSSVNDNTENASKPGSKEKTKA
ncbi:sodium channel subunit beta-4 [Bombina bombina]|uniref:sodium channel subunit beta-4 n=1 Tax=Bombina bombina TaxID=8345 RepID=UPI00235B12A3|nr:sodium channel subunit beta-4 [Bombina bombina]